MFVYENLIKRSNVFHKTYAIPCKGVTITEEEIQNLLLESVAYVLFLREHKAEFPFAANATAPNYFTNSALQHA